LREQRAKAKESGMPARPQAAYFLFSMEQTPKVIEELKAEGKKAEMAVRAGMIKERWNALGAEGQAVVREVLQVITSSRYGESKLRIPYCPWPFTSSKRHLLKTFFSLSRKMTNQRTKAPPEAPFEVEWYR
jgi:hypothetical protein